MVAISSSEVDALILEVDLTKPKAILRLQQDFQKCHRCWTSTDIGFKEESKGKEAKEEKGVVVVKSL